MSNHSVNWLYVLEEDLHPAALTANAEQLTACFYYANSLKDHAQTFRPYFVGLVGRSQQEARIILIQLINVSNVIHHYMVGMTGLWNEHSLSTQMRQLYCHTLMQLEVLLEFCGKFDDLISASLPLTTYSISDTRMQLRKKVDKLSRELFMSEIDVTLSELILSGLKQLIRRKELNRSEAEYADLIINRLSKATPLNTIEAENLLYQYDFNTPEFFNYCAKGCDNLLLVTPCLYGQLEILIELENRMSGLPPRTTSRWVDKDESIREQLTIFLKEKKAYVKQRIELRRLELEDSKLAARADRQLVNLPVTQFGLFIRLFMEKGILPKDDVSKTFAYYAENFRTPNTPFISAESLQKKSSTIEFTTANKIKGHLIGMVNWLNEHHNTQRGEN